MRERAIDVRTSKWILRETGCACGLDSSSQGQGRTVGFCKRGNTHSVSLGAGNFLTNK